VNGSIKAGVGAGNNALYFVLFIISVFMLLGVQVDLAMGRSYYLHICGMLSRCFLLCFLVTNATCFPFVCGIVSWFLLWYTS